MSTLRRLATSSLNTLKRPFSSQSDMLSNKFKLGLCQILVGDDKQKNLQTASNAIDKAANKGADIIVLPVLLHIIIIT